MQSESSTNGSLYNMVIESHTEYKGTHCVVLAKYANHSNFGGLKLMVLKGTGVPPFNQDPHFFEDARVLARFIPTDKGMEMAKLFAEALDLQKPW